MMEKATGFFVSRSRDITDVIVGLLATVLLVGIVLFLKSPLLLFGILMLICGAAILWFFYPYLPLLIFLLLPFSLEIQVTGNTRLTVLSEPLIFLLILCVCGEMLLKGKFNYRSSPLNVAIFLLYGWMVVSLFFTWVPISTIKAIVRDTGYILTGYYIIPRYVTSARKLKHIVFGCLIFHLLLVLYGFFTQAVGGIRIYADIANPFFVEHCIYAAFLTVTFAFLLAYVLDMEPGQNRFLLGIVTAVVGVAIVLTFVRAAWISIAALLVFYLVQYRHRRSAVDTIMVLLVFVITGIVLMLTTDLGNLFLQRFDTLTDFQYVANYDRLDRWTAAWHMWMDHIVHGVGWGAYPDVYYFYIFLKGAYSTHIRMGAHNLYLEYLAELGIVGFFLFLSIIFIFFREAYVLQHRVKNAFLRVFLIAIQGSMLTYLIHAFLNNLGPSDKISLTFWFFLGMIPTLRYLVDKENEEESKPAVPPE